MKLEIQILAWDRYINDTVLKPVKEILTLLKIGSPTTD